MNDNDIYPYIMDAC